MLTLIDEQARHSQVCSIENRDICVCVCVCVIVRMSLLTFSTGILKCVKKVESKFEISDRTCASSEFSLILKNGRGH